MCSQVDLARAILQAVDRGAHVINISGGQLLASGSAEPLLDMAIRTCAERNVVVIAAAGNPGVVAGAVTLMSGQTVPAVGPSPRGMYSWAPAFGR